MFKWNAKVHKSGNKVAVFNGSKLMKMVEASKETFEPAEAQKFAEKLLEELETRTSAQMRNPADQPSVVPPAEQQIYDLPAVAQQAQGKAPHMGPSAQPAAAPEVPEAIEEDDVKEEDDKPEDLGKSASIDKLAKENAELRHIASKLKKRLAQEIDERATERKARRGLAIAKQMVIEGKLEDSYDTIKNKVAEIVKLEDSEITRLEKKVAGEQEFDSIEDASKEARKQSRIARINRQAAAEAQEDGDEKEADSLDRLASEAEAKTAHIEQIIEEMKTAAACCEKKDPTEEAAASCEKKDPATEKTEEEAAKPVIEPEAAKKEEPAKKEQETPEKGEATEKGEGSGEEPGEAAEKETTTEEAEEDKLASMARKYRRIASSHRKLAEKAEAEGDVAAADKEDNLADEAEEKAEEIEKKLEKPEEKVAEKTETPAEEAKEEVTETPAEEAKEEKAEAEKPAEEAKEETEEEGKDASGNSPLKREGEVIDSFGIDKNASLVEQNDYAHDPEVELLSSIWRGAPKEE